MPTILAPPFSAGPPSESVRFLLNGAVKTVDAPVTGNALHSIAGFPASLMRGEQVVPNDYNVFYLVEGQAITATY